MRRPVVAVLLALSPLLLALLAAGALLLAFPDVVVRFTVAPAVLAGLVGVAISALLLGAVMINRLTAKRRQDALEAGAAHAKAEHLAFLSRLDHEMKNPLTAIRAALAAHGIEGSSHLQVADAQAARLGSLVGDLRKLSELQSRPLEVEPVDLGQIVGDSVQAVTAYLQQVGSARTFGVHFPTVPWRIPPVQGDPDLLYLAVFNLLANAAKFTSDGDTVEVRAGEADGRVWLEVADTGLGIPAADLAQVWDELARAANARGIAGSGLGLPLVRIVVERHGGRVSLRSREGEGTAVRMELPIGRAPRPLPAS